MRMPFVSSLLVCCVACSTTSTHPELVAKAAQVRVVHDSSQVAGCTFLNSVSGTEEPPYTSRNGLIVYDKGTPAITMLQIAAQAYGADAVEVTNSEKTYRATSARANTLTTLTGNAYRCAGTTPAVVPASRPVATPGVAEHAEKGNATIKIHALYLFAPDGKSQDVSGTMGWLTVDADIEGNHVLAYYDFTLGDQRTPLEGCWLDEGAKAQCRQRAADGLIAVLEVDGRNLRAPGKP